MGSGPHWAGQCCLWSLGESVGAGETLQLQAAGRPLSIPGPSTQQAKCFLPTLQSSTAALGTEGHGVHVFFRGWK